jgi:hypothetical protein
MSGLAEILAEAEFVQMVFQGGTLSVGLWEVCFGEEGGADLIGGKDLRCNLPIKNIHAAHTGRDTPELWAVETEEGETIISKPMKMIDYHELHELRIRAKANPSKS